MTPFIARLKTSFVHAFRTRLVLLSRRRVWVEILLMGFLTAVGIAIWPTARCAAFQACDTRDRWCASDCTSACTGSNGLGYVSGCYRSGSGCFETWHADSVDGTCSNASNCNVTSVDRQSGRLSSSGGYTYWNAGACSWSNNCTAILTNSRRVDCCGGAVSSGGCSPEYASPIITLGSTTPRYPLVYGQDPDRLGVTVAVNAQGGAKTNGCDEGPDQQSITNLTLNGVSLSASSTHWITSILAARYPGAVLKGSYPLRPTASLTGLNTSRATASFHFDPLDPGVYELSVSAIQGDGQNLSATLNVAVHLLDATITLPLP